MYEDKNGRPLDDEQWVLIPAKITGRGRDRGDGANISVVTRFPNPVSGVLTPIVLNSKQVVLDPEPVF